MKRKIYEIHYCGLKVVKNAHNSAIREIEAIVRKTAREENAEYTLTKSGVLEREGAIITKAVREWTGSNGKVLKFEVVKIQ